MVELTVLYKSRMEQASAYKKSKYLDLTTQLGESGYRAKIVPIQIGAIGFVVLSSYDLLRKFSISGNKRTKSLKTSSQNSKKQFLLDLEQKK
ncbi:reverse transcriptase [Elysia marginata]|uniref:Reverse transcriptase n=1 Tax=Elysia marginata TaxID=1093978 RepID=A0AAV4EL79_9GAST|nr:reverse transcriptase [Elysia marginata]